MKKPRLLVALGLILAAAAAIVGFAAPGSQTSSVGVTVTVSDSFSLTLDNSSVSLTTSGFSESEVGSSNIIATATSNWPKGYTISVTSATAVKFNGQDLPAGPPPPSDSDYILLNDIIVAHVVDTVEDRSSLDALPWQFVSETTKTSKSGKTYTIKFYVDPDGEEYAGAYTTNVTFTMAPKT